MSARPPRRPRVVLWLAAGVMVVQSACNSNSGALPTPSFVPAIGQQSVVLVGAGDIAICGFVNAERTARLLDDIPGLVFTAGDNAQVDATPEEFRDCYHPTWGRHRDRTFPSPGNHEYLQPGGLPYYQYFGDRAGPFGLGYYTYNAGAWQIFSLNSNVPAGRGSAQYDWVEEELQSSNALCRMAYWHFPLFSSGFDGNRQEMRDLWALLHQYGAELVVSGHSHNYERFAPQDVAGNASPRGIRQFVVGTGGAGLLPLIQLRPNSEVFDNTSMGVLKLTLHPASYDWQFIPIPQHSFTDSGSGLCH